MRSKVERATEANWEFTQIPEAMGAVHWAASKGAALFEHVERGDAVHDVMLHLAVRPELVAKAVKTGDWTSLAQTLYVNALRPDAISQVEFSEPRESMANYASQAAGHV